MKKFSYIRRAGTALCLALLLLLLTACSAVYKPVESSSLMSASQPAPSSEASAARQESAVSEAPDTSSSLPSEGESSAEKPEEAGDGTVSLTVSKGAYLIGILQQLVDLGFADDLDSAISESQNLDIAESKTAAPLAEADLTGRSYRYEGYIAPGIYQLDTSEDLRTVLTQLFSSWDSLLTDQQIRQAADKGWSIDQLLTLASIVEAESSHDPAGTVYPQVAAVFDNRLDQGMQLQSDVTIFYLQEGLDQSRTEDQCQPYYDTYQVEALPAGPIGSPSLDAVKAVLEPADTDDLFFVYDDSGNYYFAADWDTHVENCKKAGIE